MRGFILARPEGQSVPRVVEKDLAAGAAFEVGALLLVNGSGQYAECGADPVSIAAVAESGAGADTSGFNILARKEFPSGRMTGTAVRNMLFRARYVGALPAADGGAYGVIKDADGFWKVDFNEAVNTRVRMLGRLTDSPINVPEVLVKFLDANVQDV
jgi:hypothetical protein